MRLLDKLRNDFLKFKSSAELKKSLIYTAASAGAYGIVFIQNFSLAYFVSIDFFGKISLIISLFSTLYVIHTLGLNSVVLRYNFDTRFISDRKKFISSIISIWFPIGLVLTILFLIIGARIISNDFLNLDYWSEFVPIVIGAFAFSIIEIFPQIFVVDEKPINYAISLVLTRLAIFIALHLAVVFFGESELAISMGLLSASLCLLVACILVFRVLPIVRVNLNDVKEIFVYTLPLMIYSLGGIGYSHGYRVIISSQLSLQDLAIFTIGSQIASTFYLASSSSVMGLQPKAFQRLEENEGNPDSIRFYLRALIYVGLIYFVTIYAVAYLFLVYFKNGIFMPAFKILPILLGGQFVFFLYGYNYLLCAFYRNTRVLTYSMLMGVTTSLILAYLLLNDSILWRAALPIFCGFLIQFLSSLGFVKFKLLKT